jgi:hypothetical protein
MIEQFVGAGTTGVCSNRCINTWQRSGGERNGTLLVLRWGGACATLSRLSRDFSRHDLENVVRSQPWTTTERPFSFSGGPSRFDWLGRLWTHFLSRLPLRRHLQNRPPTCLSDSQPLRRCASAIDISIRLARCSLPFDRTQMPDLSPPNSKSPCRRPLN